MTEKKNQLSWQGAMGLMGVLVWMFMFGIVEYANDMLMAKRGSETLWTNVYQVSAGYVLGFVAAIAIWLLWRLTQGRMPEMLSETRWARWLTALGLVGVISSALAGLVMPNMGGLKLTYDVAFVIAIVVVYSGVIPLYKTWKS
jgi:hypothetical protein